MSNGGALACMAQTEVEAAKLLQERANALADAAKADVLLYTGPIDRPHDDRLLDEIRGRKAKRERVLFFITTYGGSADAAYRIARSLRRHYKHVTAVVPGFCKSAGTLVVLGADELVMFDHAELGPLDVQLRKEDEYAKHSSGLTPTQAFQSLDSQVVESVRSLFLSLKLELNLSTRTAVQLTSDLVARVYGGIYAQVEPIRLGEIHRAQAIALQYARRLVGVSKCTSEDSVRRLVSGYPSHEFVIDFDEAKTLFKTVREPSAAERAFEEKIHDVVRTPFSLDSRPVILFFNEAPAAKETNNDARPAESDHVVAAGDDGHRASADGRSQPAAGANARRKRARASG
ncbi:MAG: SppA protein [Polyangiales bacterium]